MYIAGEWRAALDGAQRREIRLSAQTASWSRQAAEASAADTRGRDRRGTPRLRRPSRGRARRNDDRAGGAAAHRRPHRPRPQGLRRAPKRSTPASGSSRPNTTSTTSARACVTTRGIGGTDAGRVVDTGRADAISRLVYEPVGVCGLITPWNYPLLQASLEGCPSAVGRQHLRAQTERTDAVDLGPAHAGVGGGGVCQPASPISCSAPGPRRVRHCPNTPTWTWCRSPVVCRRAPG